MSRALLQFGFFSRSLPVAVAVGVGTSLLIETTQFTGIWGIYSCAHRLADIDDILANSVGGLVGGLLAPIVLSWMPSEQTFRAARGNARPITTRRRWLGMAIDFALYSAVGSVLLVCYRVILLVATGEVPPVPNIFEAALGSLVPAMLIFVAPAARRSGASLGQTAVWLVPYWTQSASVGRRIFRGASVGGLYGVLTFASHLPVGFSPVAGAVSIALGAAAVVAVPLTRGRAGLSGLLTGATMRDERSVERLFARHGVPTDGHE
jgi:hypothetical protein